MLKISITFFNKAPFIYTYGSCTNRIVETIENSVIDLLK